MSTLTREPPAMSIKRVEFLPMPLTNGVYPYVSANGLYCLYNDHIKVVDAYLAEIAAAKAEIDKLMSSLESWDEEFK